jgi:peptide/nickel transport system permease protein
LPNTLLLMSFALVGSIVIGASVGAWQGARAGSRGDRALSFAVLMLYAIPEFVLGAGLLWFVVLVLRLNVPAGGMYDEVQHDSMTTGVKALDVARHLALPWLSLTAIGAAVFARYQRAAVREMSGEPFVRTARAKGLNDRQIRRQVRLAARLPVITLAGLFFPSLLTGAVFVEKIYSWPGMGLTLLDAISKRDYALVSACIIIGSAMTALGSLLADVVRAAADPRLRAPL